MQIFWLLRSVTCDKWRRDYDPQQRTVVSWSFTSISYCLRVIRPQYRPLVSVTDRLWLLQLLVRPTFASVTRLTVLTNRQPFTGIYTISNRLRITRSQKMANGSNSVVDIQKGVLYMKLTLSQFIHFDLVGIGWKFHSTVSDWTRKLKLYPKYQKCVHEVIFKAIENTLNTLDATPWSKWYSIWRLIVQ
jgi:hypothetical protein